MELTDKQKKVIIEYYGKPVIKFKDKEYLRYELFCKNVLFKCNDKKTKHVIPLKLSGNYIDCISLKDCFDMITDKTKYGKYNYKIYEVHEKLGLIDWKNSDGFKILDLKNNKDLYYKQNAFTIQFRKNWKYIQELCDIKDAKYEDFDDICEIEKLVGKEYRIDMLFLNAGIGIEYDEQYHEKQIKKDNTRMEDIVSRTGINILKFPYNGNFVKFIKEMFVPCYEEYMMITANTLTEKYFAKNIKNLIGTDPSACKFLEMHNVELNNESIHELYRNQTGRTIKEICENYINEMSYNELIDYIKKNLPEVVIKDINGENGVDYYGLQTILISSMEQHIAEGDWLYRVNIIIQRLFFLMMDDMRKKQAKNKEDCMFIIKKISEYHKELTKKIKNKIKSGYIEELKNKDMIIVNISKDKTKKKTKMKPNEYNDGEKVFDDINYLKYEEGGMVVARDLRPIHFILSTYYSKPCSFEDFVDMLIEITDSPKSGIADRNTDYKQILNISFTL